MRKTTSIRLLYATPIALIFIGVILFSTCKGNDSGSGSGSSNNSEDAVALAGSWSTSCLQDASRPNSYVKDIRTFDGLSFMTAFTTYSDNACTQPIMIQEQAGTFAIGAVANNDDASVNGDARQLDITINAIFVTLATDSQVKTYNDRQICGGGWTKNVKRQITKSECNPDSSNNSDVDLIYDIFIVKGTSLYFGRKAAGTAGSSPETRPAELEISKVFTQA
jgi:hypothetical protein